MKLLFPRMIMYIYDTSVTYGVFFYEMLHYLKLYFVIYTYKQHFHIFILLYSNPLIVCYRSSYCIQSFVCILLCI